MSDIGLGKLITTEQHRDAVHVAVAPCVAGHYLKPGQHVGLLDGEACSVGCTHIGIADPFIVGSIPKGSKFWLYLYPGSITSLRHDWTHPAFKSAGQTAIDESTRASAVKALCGFAGEIDVDYDTLLEGATEFLQYGEYMCRGGDFEGISLPDDFWDNFSIVTGTVVPRDKQHNFFTCSC